jgi:hypothetical protein
MFDTLTSWSEVLSALALLPCFYLLFWGVKGVFYRVAVRKAGCSSPVKYWHKDPIFGLDLFVQRIKDMTGGDSLATDRILLDMYGKTVLTNN